MRIVLHYRQREKALLGALFRVEGYLRDHGITLVDRGESDPEPETGSCFCVQQYFLSGKLIEFRPPTILLERADAAISWCRKETQLPFVRKVIKIGILRDWTQNNSCRGRYHSYLLGARASEPDRLSEADAAKLVAGPAYGAFDLMRWWQTRDYLGEAKVYDCHFAGTVTYEKADEITRHRTGAMSALRAMPGRHFLATGRDIPRQEYNDALGKSKICVSPWGFGELTYRDFEAFYAGAVVIKPNSDFVLSWPDLMRSGRHYVSCAPDWSDLADVVQRVLDSWSSFEEMRICNRTMLLQSWQEQEVGLKFRAVFEEAFGNDT